MKKLLIPLLLAFSLSGCAAWNAITGAQLSPKAVYIAVNSFDALERTATNYLRLKKCNGTTIICRDPIATSKLIPAIQSARLARNNLEQFLKTHPGQLGPQGLYDALENAMSTIETIVNQYNIQVLK